MRVASGFVNSDPTRYCAYLLGQSQDVDVCGLWKNEERACRPQLFRVRGSEGWQVGGCLFDRPPVVHRQGLRWGRVPSAGCERNEVAPIKSKRGATGKRAKLH